MSVHPKFDIEHSHCGNCAAFNGTVEGNNPMGTCHRFAPRPEPVLVHFPASPSDDAGLAETNPKGFSWPLVEDDFWCLDWFPMKASAQARDESRWAEFYATLSVRAKNALVHEDLNIRSFARLDELTDHELLRARLVGRITVAEIREKRKAFPGDPTK